MKVLTNLWIWITIPILVYLLWIIGSVFAPFIVATYIAYLLSPMVNHLTNWKVPRSIAALLCLLLVLVAIVAIIALLIPLIEAQLIQLSFTLPVAFQELQNLIQPWLQRFDIAAPAINGKQVIALLQEHWQVAGTGFEKLSAVVLSSGSALMSVVLYIVIIPVVAFYFLCDWEKFVQRKPQWFSLPSVARTIQFLQEVDKIMRTFLQGQLTLMIIMGAVYGVALSWMGLSVGPLLGIIIGLLTIVPYLGFFIGLLLALLFAFVQFQDLMHLGYILAIFFSAAAFENMILVPRLMGTSLGLHPVAVIFAVLAGGKVFGMIGVLLAIPVAAIAKIAYRHLDAHLTQLAQQNRQPT